MATQPVIPLLFLTTNHMRIAPQHLSVTLRICHIRSLSNHKTNLVAEAHLASMCVTPTTHIFKRQVAQHKHPTLLPLDHNVPSQASACAFVPMSNRISAVLAATLHKCYNSTNAYQQRSSCLTTPNPHAMGVSNDNKQVSACGTGCAALAVRHWLCGTG
jgi:hypothetical protein